MAAVRRGPSAAGGVVGDSAEFGRPPDPVGGRTRTLGAVWIPALTIAGMVAAIVPAARYGAGVTPDSVAYLSAAKNFAAGSGFMRFDGVEYVHWPPLFPFLLSIRADSVLDAATTARWINVVAFGGLVAIVALWLRALLATRWLAILGTAIVAFGYPLIWVTTHVWSEPLFLLLSILTWRALERARAPGAGAYKVVASVLAALAVLTRYAGLFLVISCALALLVSPGPFLRRRLPAVVMFLGIASIPTLLWLSRNVHVDETVAGERATSVIGPDSLIRTMAGTLTRWVLPRALPIPVRASVVLAVVAALAILAYRANGSVFSMFSRSPLLAPVLFLPIYSAGVIMASSVTKLIRPYDRLLSPLYVPGLLVGLVLLDAVLKRGSRTTTAATAAGLALLIVYNLAAIGHMTTPAFQADAARFAGPRWSNSALMSYVKGHAFAEATFTNESQAVYYSTEKYLPAVPDDALEGEHASFDDSGGSATIVWFDTKRSGTLEDLTRTMVLDPLEVFQDGAVYRARMRD